MDGQYGNVTFICTKSDRIVPTETYKDPTLNALAAQEPGRREKILQLVTQHGEAMEQIKVIDKDRDARREQLAALKAAVEDAKKAAQDDKKARKAADKAFTKRAAGGAPVAVRLHVAPGGGAVGVLASTGVAEARGAAQRSEDVWRAAHGAYSDAAHELELWSMAADKDYERLERDAKALNRQLKPLCAKLRNEFSTATLQRHFREGLEELCRGPDEEERDEGAASSSAPLPKPLADNYNIDVHCVSANDYLMLTKIKDKADGDAATFEHAEDTNIPALRAAVHATTARNRQSFAHSVLRKTSDFVDELQLACRKAAASAPAAGGAQCESLLARELGKLKEQWAAHSRRLVTDLLAEVNSTLKPKFRSGVERGQQQALATAESWGSKDKRTKTERKGGGLAHSTYQATAARDGSWTSPTVGEIDWNQELADPVQQAFMVGWEQTMNTKTNELLHACREVLKAAAADANEQIREALDRLGVPPEDLAKCAQAAGRAVGGVIQDAMAEVGQYATSRQREINRMLQPQIRERMKPGYRAAANSRRGAGLMQRMTDEVTRHASAAMRTLLDESIEQLVRSIEQLIDELGKRVDAVQHDVVSGLRRLYSAHWERDQQGTAVAADAQKTRAARDEASRRLAPKRQQLDEAMARAGIA
jgi:hypothetical protein